MKTETNQQITKKLQYLNQIIPPIFNLRKEKDDLNLYFKEMTKVTDKQGNPIFNFKKLETLYSGNSKEILTGLGLINVGFNMMMQWRKIVSQQPEK